MLSYYFFNTYVNLLGMASCDYLLQVYSSFTNNVDRNHISFHFLGDRTVTYIFQLAAATEKALRTTHVL